MLVNQGKQVSARVTASGGRVSDDLAAWVLYKKGKSTHYISLYKDVRAEMWRQGKVPQRGVMNSCR